MYITAYLKRRLYIFKKSILPSRASLRLFYFLFYILIYEYMCGLFYIYRFQTYKLVI